MFHQHTFYPHPSVPDMLFCRCGKTKDLHRHEWEKKQDIEHPDNENIIGSVLGCKTYGERRAMLY